MRQRPGQRTDHQSGPHPGRDAPEARFTGWEVLQIIFFSLPYIVSTTFEKRTRMTRINQILAGKPKKICVNPQHLRKSAFSFSECTVEKYFLRNTHYVVRVACCV